MDVVTKEGMLFLQGVKFGKKIWRKTWLILFEPSLAGIGRMELYDMRDGGGVLGFAPSKTAGLKKTDKRVIRLADCLSITPAPGETCPTDYSAFFLNTTSCTYTIAAPTSEDWISVLCQMAFQPSNGSEDSRKNPGKKYMQLADNELYSTWGAGQFQVTVHNTDAAQRCRMSGSYLLSSEKEAICLLDLKTGQAVFNWPYRLLRRFGQVKGGIMIEAGRRCHTGEGQFIFLSKQGPQIHRAIEEAIMHQSVQDMLAQASTLPQEFASQSSSSQKKTQDRSHNKPPPITTNQEKPRLVVQRKPGQQIHKAIEQVLIHQNVQELLEPSTPLIHSVPPPPPSPKAKPQNRSKDKQKVKKHQEKPCPGVQHTHGQPLYSTIEKVLGDQDVQRFPMQYIPPPQAPPPLPPSPKTKPKVRSNVNKHPPAKMHQERPCPAVPRRNIALPELPCAKNTASSPDDVLYATILPQPMPRTKTNLPKVPPPPSLPPHGFRTYIKQDTEVIMNRDKEGNSSHEPSENTDTDYTNWAAKTTANQDQPNIEDLYSKVNYATKLKNKQTDDAGDQEQSKTEQQNPVTTSTEIPTDFRQTLSNILSKIPPSVPPRSHGGSSEILERMNE